VEMGWLVGLPQGGPVCLGVRMLVGCVAIVGVLVCLGFYFELMLREVGRNCQDFRAGFDSEEGNCEVRLIRGWYVEGLFGMVE